MYAYICIYMQMHNNINELEYLVITLWTFKTKNNMRVYKVMQTKVGKETKPRILKR